MNDKSKVAIIAASIVVGLVLSGYLLGRSIQRFKKEDRYITVKGFSEREVKSNFAVWTIKTRITTNDLQEGSKAIEENKQKIVSFLVNSGINKNEILQQNLNVTDKLAREYSSNDIGGYRYIIENAIQVRTKNVDIVEKVSKQTDKLLKVGVVLADNQDYNPSVKYLYTDLNQIKPQMLSEAIQNAKKAAVEFTKESGVKLETLKKANQGLFSIADRDNSISGNEGGYSTNVNDVYKKIKVVINVEYSIR